jgi:PAS domain-containing protein
VQRAGFREQFSAIADAWALAQGIVDTVREPVLVLDKDLRVIAASRSFYSAFKVSPEDTKGRLLYTLGDGQWDIPKLRVFLEKIISEKGVMESYEVEHEFPGLGHRTMRLNARRVFYEGGADTTILLGIEDVTAQRLLEREKDELLRQFEEARAFAQAIVDTVREPFLVLDKDLRVLAASRSFYSAFKVGPEDTQDKLLYALGDGQWDIPKLHLLLEKIVPEQGVMEGYEVEQEFPGLGHRTMLLNARKVFYEEVPTQPFCWASRTSPAARPRARKGRVAATEGGAARRTAAPGCQQPANHRQHPSDEGARGAVGRDASPSRRCAPAGHVGGCRAKAALCSRGHRVCRNCTLSREVVRESRDLDDRRHQADLAQGGW